MGASNSQVKDTNVNPEVTDQSVLVNKCADATDATKITPTESDETKITPTESDATKITPTESDATKITPTESDTTKITPTESDATKITPTESDTTKITPTESDVTKITPTQSDVTKIIPTDSDIKETFIDFSSIEVITKPYDVSTESQTTDQQPIVEDKPTELQGAIVLEGTTGLQKMVSHMETESKIIVEELAPTESKENDSRLVVNVENKWANEQQVANICMNQNVLDEQRANNQVCHRRQKMQQQISAIERAFITKPQNEIKVSVILDLGTTLDDEVIKVLEEKGYWICYEFNQQYINSVVVHIIPKGVNF